MCHFLKPAAWKIAAFLPVRKHSAGSDSLHIPPQKASIKCPGLAGTPISRKSCRSSHHLARPPIAHRNKWLAPNPRETGWNSAPAIHVEAACLTRVSQRPARACEPGMDPTRSGELELQDHLGQHKAGAHGPARKLEPEETVAWPSKAMGIKGKGHLQTCELLIVLISSNLDCSLEVLLFVLGGCGWLLRQFHHS